MKKYNNFLSYVLCALVYISITLFFLRDVIFSPGIFMGGDWGYPLSIIQMQRFASSGFYTWSDREILGTEQFFLSLLPFQIFLNVLAQFGITGDIYSKFLLVVTFVFPALAMYAFCRFLNCKKTVAFFGGFIYMTLPIFFNYSAMGWLFVLFSMGLLPLSLIFFVKSIREKKIAYALFTGLLYSLAGIQSQSFVWYPLVYLCCIPYLIEDKKSFIAYVKSFCLVIIVCLGFNAYWYLPLFLSGGSGVLNTQLGASTASLGTWSRLSVLNILRLWGSLFNEPYEASVNNSLAPLSFVFPFAAYLSLYLFKKNGLVYSLLLLTCIPIILFVLGPGFIVKLPFSDLIRDVARFLVLSSFAYVVLVSLVLNVLLQSKQQNMRLLGVLIIILLTANTYMFWLGELSGTQRLQHDIRLRTYKFSQEHFDTERSLLQEKEDIKVLYLPIAGELSITNDKRFYSSYKGIRDIFGSFSPKTGMIGLSDRLGGFKGQFAYQMEDMVNRKMWSDLRLILKMIDVKYIVIRKNMTHPAFSPGKEIASSLKKTNMFTLYKDGFDVAVFQNNDILPHIYVPQEVVISRKNIDSLPKILTKTETNRPVIYFSSQNLTLQSLKNSSDHYLVSSNQEKSRVKYEKIDPTKYHVVLYNVKNTFPLVFSESYHGDWKLYRLLPQDALVKNTKLYETWFQKPFFEDQHLMANGYANSWVIDTKRLCTEKNISDLVCQQNSDGSYTISMVIEFWPQRMMYIGFGIAIGTFMVIMAYLGLQKYKRAL